MLMDSHCQVRDSMTLACGSAQYPLLRVVWRIRVMHATGSMQPSGTGKIPIASGVGSKNGQRP